MEKWTSSLDKSKPEEIVWFEVWAEFKDKSGWMHIATCKNETSAGCSADSYAAQNPGTRVVAVRRSESRTPIQEYEYEE